MDSNVGIGKVELNKRMAQHKALRDKALNKSKQAEKEKDMYLKVIGQHGSKLSLTESDDLYKSADLAYVKAKSQRQKAVYHNQSLVKLTNKLGK